MQATEETNPGGDNRVAVVVNGNARHVTEELVSVLDQIVRSGDLFVSRSLDEGQRIARTVVSRGYRTVLTGGGDGTFVQMVTRIVLEAERQGRPIPRFGPLKLGTGNALAWVLGTQSGGRKGVVADIERLRTEGGSRKLRLMRVEDMLTPMAGLGVDAICLDHYNDTKDTLGRFLPRGLSSGLPVYALSISSRSLPEFLLRPHPHVRIINEGAPAQRIGPDDRPLPETFPEGAVLYDGPSRLVGMSTVPFWGFGVRVFPFADERDDRFHLRVGDIRSSEVLRNMRGIWRGTYRAPSITDLLVERVGIYFDDPMPLQIGGDVVGRRRFVRAALAEPIEVVDFYAPPPT